MLAWWLVRRKRHGQPALIDPDLFASKQFRLGISGQLIQQIALGGTMIALPIFLQMVLEYNAMQAGLSLAPLSLSMFAVALLAGKRAGRPPPAEHHPRSGSCCSSSASSSCSRSCPRADVGLVPGRSRSIVAGCGLGLLVSQLNNYTLSPISEERVSEAAGVNSAGGSFGLSFGLAFAGAVMLGLAVVRCSPTWRRTARCSSPTEQQQVADALEEDAELMSNTQLDELLVGQPPAVQAEIIRINTDARRRARCRYALLVPIARGADRPRSTRCGCGACPTSSRSGVEGMLFD